MKERLGGELDPFWQQDLMVGEVPLLGEPTAVRARLHQSVERYAGKDNLYPLTQRRGEHQYVMAEFYALFPQFQLEIELANRPDVSGAIGTVTGSEWASMRHQHVGTAQAWLYPADEVLVLWEVLMDEWTGTDVPPAENEALAGIWRGLEGILVARFKPEIVATPAWEPMYHELDWQRFLTAQGYARLEGYPTFIKNVGE